MRTVPWSAKEIPDKGILDILAQPSHGGVPRWHSWWDIAQHWYPDVPPKVVLAKLRGMLRRRLIDGCGCGCRGDFRLPEVRY